MKLHLILVGKTTDTAVKQLVEGYEKRLQHYYPFQLEIVESNPSKSALPERIKQGEGEGLLKKMLATDYVILLDERGKEWTSEAFAQQLSNFANQAKKRIVFVVGGAFGFSDVVKQRANGTLSLSKMTFSHQIVRALFMEQLYRACTIIKGEPYHHSG